MSDKPSPPESCVATKSSGDALMPDNAAWFRQEVHLHDRQLRSFLRNQFPGFGEVDDVVQESYLRVWKIGRPVEFAKAFLFKVARRVALDSLRKTRNSPIAAFEDLSRLPVAEDLPSAVDQLSAREKLRLLADALAALPPRCRDILILTKLQGHTHREVAETLGISIKTVDEQVYRGLRRLETELHQRGIDGFFGV